MILQSIFTTSTVFQVLPYDQLMQELDVTNVRELEDFLINECMYAVRTILFWSLHAANILMRGISLPVWSLHAVRQQPWVIMVLPPCFVWDLSNFWIMMMI